MLRQCAGIFFTLLILMATKVDSKFQRSEDLNARNIELWHGMKSAVNNDETHHSLKSVARLRSPVPPNLISHLSPFPTEPPPVPLLPGLLPVPIYCPKISSGYSQFQITAHAYKFHKEYLNWNDAKRRCQAESARLVVIENGAQYDTVLELASRKSRGKAFFHVGLRRRSYTEPWRTIDGDRLPFVKWTSRQANRTRPDANCVGFAFIPNTVDGLFAYSCMSERNFMCEIKLPPECRYMHTA